MGNEFAEYTVANLITMGIIEKPIDGNHGEIHPKTGDFVDAGIPFIMASDLVNGGVDIRNCSFISELQASGLRKGFSVEGDVLLSHKATLGRTAIVPPLKTPYIILTPQVTYYRVKDSHRLNNRFLKFYFDSPVFQALLVKWSGGGSTRAYIGITEQQRLPVILPPIINQKAIAHILGTLDDKIELLRQMNETLEAMARALFKSWFVDFDPVRKKAEGLPTGLPPEIDALFPDSFEDSELGEIPKGWNITPFSDQIDIIGGGTPKTSISEYWQGTIPWYSVVDSPKYSDVFVIDTEKHISQSAIEHSSTRLLPEGTTIISARGTVGNLALVGTPMCMNQSCYGIRWKQSSGDFYTYFALRNLVQILKGMVHGSVFDTITRETFSSAFTVNPPTTLIRTFSSFVSPILDMVKFNLYEIKTNSILRDSLLPKLISGNLEVKDIDKILEPAI